MKRAFAYLLIVLVLCAAFYGCNRTENDSDVMTPVPTAIPSSAPTATPSAEPSATPSTGSSNGTSILPSASPEIGADGIVRDGDGIIEDSDSGSTGVTPGGNTTPDRAK